jgi:putative ABC transport system permease protein
MDIAGAQQHFGSLGRLSRIDLRLATGADRAAVLRELALPRDVRVASPDEATLRVSNLSRAYRVNLTVLALVALFTGAFLVFSVQSLSVARRIPQLALLGVLGLAAPQRRALVLWDALLLGVLGSASGIALGTALALVGLRWLGGDLGSGMLGSATPALHFSIVAAAGYGALGIAAALLGSWVPARMAERIAPAQSLKGLGNVSAHRASPWVAPTLLALGTALAFAPPVAGLPLAAYASVACVLLGGVAAVPTVVELLLRVVRVRHHAVALLAVERTRDQRHAATIAVAGVVAALSLAAALTIMVASFRDSVSHWLDQVLPADLYARTAATSASAQTAYLEPSFVQSASSLRGVLRVQAQRTVPLVFDPAQPAVSLVARPLRGAAGSQGNAGPLPSFLDPLGGRRRASAAAWGRSDEPNLPLVGPLAPARQDGSAAVEVYASENFAALYGAAAGDLIDLPLPGGTRVKAQVRGLWRDYARTQGSIAIDLADWRRLTGDTRVNDLALWLSDEADLPQVQAALRALVADPALIELATPGEIRALSLRIFDRSFAVTYWLQAVAIGIGLFGIAASVSAQVLARRKEFGSLQHLGFTRAQVLALVAAEALVWTAAGALLGLALGFAVAVVLVHVVNPQSFHWRMDLSMPWLRLLALAAAVLVSGALTAWLAARAAATREMALAVKEDW